MHTLYIGGGTPSVLPLRLFERLVGALASEGYAAPFDEFTVEVNPEDIAEKGAAYVEGLLKLGVNRISMGVQSFDDDILRFMNRRHDADTARRAYAVLEDAGVDNISIDLIFGLPQLTETGWKDTLLRALDISSRGVMPRHISSYQLSVEQDSALERMIQTGRFAEASDELCRSQYSVLCEMLAEAGYNHYEISNFAVPGFEAKHNSAYWEHIPYVGLGAGAHSYRIAPVSRECRSIRSWNKDDLQAYIAAARGGNFSSVCESEVLTPEQTAIEHIMLSLRTSKGLSYDYLALHCPTDALQRAIALGNLVPTSFSELRPAVLRIPESRFFISDSIISSLL